MQIWAFWVKNYQLSNFNEILSVSYIEGADFKSHICFRKFRAQIPRLYLFQHFEPNVCHFVCSINICKLCVACQRDLNEIFRYAISKVLFSMLTFTFCGSQQPSIHVMQMSPFCNLFRKRVFFFFFVKVTKYYGLDFYFFEDAYSKHEIDMFYVSEF